MQSGEPILGLISKDSIYQADSQVNPGLINRI